MPVTTFQQPNFTTDTDPTVYKTKLDAAAAANQQLAGLYAPHEAAAPNFTVVIDAGRMMVNGTLVINVPQPLILNAAHATLQRIDRGVIDELSGSLGYVVGVAAASPVAPAIPAGYLPICQVLVRALDTVITNSQITDERVFNEKVSTRGCIVGLSAPLSISSSVDTNFNWTAERYDPRGVFTAPAGAIVIPSDETLAIISACIVMPSGLVGIRRLSISSSLRGTVAACFVNSVADSLNEPLALSASTGLIDVTPTEQFAVFFYHSQGSAVNITTASYFSAEFKD